MEIIVKMACFDETSKEALYTGLFSVSVGLGCSLLASLWKPKTNEVVTVVLLTLFTLLFIAQIVYFQVFQTFGTLYSLFVGTDAITKFWSATFDGIKDSMLYIVLLLLPILVFLLAGDRMTPKGRQSRDVLFSLGFGTAFCYLIAFILIYNNSSGIMPVRYLYREAFVPNLSVSNFGVVTTLRLDAKYLLFGQREDGRGNPLPEEQAEPEQPEEPEEIEYGYNVLEIDFDALIDGETNAVIRDMHEYFKRVPPTRKNEYTGMFEGKNLVWFVGEAFSSLALDETVTPTLCRLAKEGFVLRTSTTRCGACLPATVSITLTGPPKSGVWSFRRSGDNYALWLRQHAYPLGYTCKAYHNHITVIMTGTSPIPICYEYKGWETGSR